MFFVQMLFFIVDVLYILDEKKKKRFFSVGILYLRENIRIGKSIIRVLFGWMKSKIIIIDLLVLYKNLFVQIFIQIKKTVHTKVIYTHIHCYFHFKLIQLIDFWLKFNAFFNNFVCCDNITRRSQYNSFIQRFHICTIKKQNVFLLFGPLC